MRTVLASQLVAGEWRSEQCLSCPTWVRGTEQAWIAHCQVVHHPADTFVDGRPLRLVVDDLQMPLFETTEINTEEERCDGPTPWVWPPLD